MAARRQDQSEANKPIQTSLHRRHEPEAVHSFLPPRQHSAISLPPEVGGVVKSESHAYSAESESVQGMPNGDDEKDSNLR